MLSSNRFLEQCHHLSNTVCSMVMPERDLIYERIFFKSRFVSKSRLENIRTEVEKCHELLKHPNIVPFDSCKDTETSMVLTREYVNGENLYYYVSLSNLPKAAAMAVARIISKAVKHVHDRGLTCKNLTPANIIVDSTGAVKLVDCCIDCIFYDNYNDRNTAADMLFLGPEGLNESALLPHKKSRDIWCLGLIIYLAFTGSYPWPLNNKMKILHLLERGEVKIPEGLNGELARLIVRMLDKNPMRRPDIKYICHELKVLERQGNCFRINADMAKSVGDLPMYHPSSHVGPKKVLTQSCQLDKVKSKDLLPGDE